MKSTRVLEVFRLREQTGHRVIQSLPVDIVWMKALPISKSSTRSEV